LTVKEPRETLRGLKGRRKAISRTRADFVEVPVYDRYSLAPGTCLPGPAIVEERECTTVVSFHSRFQVDGNLNLNHREGMSGESKAF